MPLWRTRILAKRILSCLPVSYRRWSAMGLFRHGRADDPSYAWRVLSQQELLGERWPTRCAP